ncbi:hypothetical protein M514_22758 [Trichuris suis]|uniref:Reverse transcriptase domain-containing protein n=1 Tax=Trichuris suis TaxID=68888 RepID=A0A085N6E5_9BILA|nr:hypothetical protein M514_22758 [Trichuris suis]
MVLSTALEHSRSSSDAFRRRYTNIVTLPIDPKVPPIRLKARNVPLAIRPRTEAEIKRLLTEKVLEPISNPKWSTPVVPVIKPTGAIRLCGDYKITINTALQDHLYPVPSVTHLLSNLSGGGYYAKIDGSSISTITGRRRFCGSSNCYHAHGRVQREPTSIWCMYRPRCVPTSHGRLAERYSRNNSVLRRYINQRYDASRVDRQITVSSRNSAKNGTSCQKREMSLWRHICRFPGI